MLPLYVLYDFVEGNPRYVAFVCTLYRETLDMLPLYVLYDFVQGNP